MAGQEGTCEVDLVALRVPAHATHHDHNVVVQYLGLSTSQTDSLVENGWRATSDGCVLGSSVTTTKAASRGYRLGWQLRAWLSHELAADGCVRCRGTPKRSGLFIDTRAGTAVHRHVSGGNRGNDTND